MAIIVSLPAMGKTTLTKKYREEGFGPSKFLDFDIKGFKFGYAQKETADLIMAMSREAHVLTFNGDWLNHCHKPVLYVIPSHDVRSEIIERSANRGDSAAFTENYFKFYAKWCIDIIDRVDFENGDKLLIIYDSKAYLSDVLYPIEEMHEVQRTWKTFDNLAIDTSRASLYDSLNDTDYRNMVLQYLTGESLAYIEKLIERAKSE